MSEERVDSRAEELDVPEEEIEATDMDNIHGCNAVIQSSDADVLALVLKPEEDDETGTASMYLHAQPFQSR